MGYCKSTARTAHRPPPTTHRPHRQHHPPPAPPTARTAHRPHRTARTININIKYLRKRKMGPINSLPWVRGSVRPWVGHTYIENGTKDFLVTFQDDLGP